MSEEKDFKEHENDKEQEAVKSNQPHDSTLVSEENKPSPDETAEPSTLIPQLSTNENMEVHHHGHVHEKKKWKEYLFQFFMLFLAVFCGFLAEYQLEQTIEHHREEQYINSLLEDVKADTAAAQFVINDFKKRYPRLDSMVNSFKNAMDGESIVFLRNRGSINSFEDFHLSDGTMQQLKNAGGLRLIRSKKAVDSISKYDAFTKDVIDQQTHLSDEVFQKVWDLQAECTDYLKIDMLNAEFKKTKVVPIPGYIFSTKDYQKLNEYYGNLKSLRGNFTIWIKQLEELKARGSRLISTLEKEYH